jgi:enoyl-CoA hydratase/carnithine racemase
MELNGASIVTVPPLLSPESIADLCAQLNSAFDDPATHVLVIRGDEQNFCRGLDLPRAGHEEDAGPALESFAACLGAIRMGIKPVVGVVQSVAAAGGLGLAAACDALLATDEATFTLTELLFGLFPAIIFPYLAERVSPQKLRWMALSAQTLNAHEAMQAGLVDFVCPSEKLPFVLRSWVRQLRRPQPQAVAMWKESTAEPSALSSRRGVGLTLERLRDPDVRAGFLDFSETGRLPSRRSDP